MVDPVGESIGQYYDRLVDRFGHDPRACDYGNPASQIAKYEALAKVSNLEGCSVLDVGCGFADYCDFLEARYAGVRYTGVDLSARMIESAKRRRPDLELVHGNVLEWPASRKFAIVTANGIFYLLGRDAPSKMRELVQKMFDLCAKAVAFNSLSAWASTRQEGEFYANPGEVVEWCRAITPWVVMRHDYLPHDFTVYLYRVSPGA